MKILAGILFIIAAAINFFIAADISDSIRSAMHEIYMGQSIQTGFICLGFGVLILVLSTKKESE